MERMGWNWQNWSLGREKEKKKKRKWKKGNELPLGVAIGESRVGWWGYYDAAGAVFSPVVVM